MSEYASVEGKSVGGSYTSIKLTVYYCNNQTLAPIAVMTTTGSARLGYTNLYYNADWINNNGFTKLQGKASAVEAMISGYWNP